MGEAMTWSWPEETIVGDDLACVQSVHGRWMWWSYRGYEIDYPHGSETVFGGELIACGIVDDEAEARRLAVWAVSP